MDERQRKRIIESTDLLRQRETTPAAFDDPYSDMTMEEKSKLIMDLVANNSRLTARLDEMAVLLESIKSQLDESRRDSIEKDSMIRSLQKQNAELLEQLKVSRKNMFGSKSQKSNRKSTSKAIRSREEDKDGFDGTPGSLTGTETDTDMPASETDVQQESKSRPYRIGMSYRKMKADRQVVHRSDKSRLPEGAVVIRMESRYSYEQVSSVIEHEYELIVYKNPDGSMHKGYFPADGEPDIIDTVPGTHASSSLMAHLAFNRFAMDTPLYRESDRLLAEKMRVSRLTLTNWLCKGGRHLEIMTGHLKDICMERDSIVNCDETWCRVKVGGKYRKKYVWCLVNKEAKTVIYSYEDGSRSREALKEIIGGRDLVALQSDGYNVYMYIDNELKDCEHLCCMAHARAKFQYASEQGGDAEAGTFVECIRELYALEDQYRKGRLTAEQISACRKSEKTMSIVIRLRSMLDAAMSPDHPPLGYLMGKAVSYLNTFWPQLMAYRNDGRYSIDNSIAERNIRPLAGERKNSLFFGSGKMASVSAAYHTIISTCKMQGISALEYLRKFFMEIVRGRRDYANLLPSTIGITANKY